jgi:FHA domain
MPACPACGTANAAEALLCSQCAMSLVEKVFDPGRTTLLTSPVAPEPAASVGHAPTTLPGEHTIVLTIDTACQPLTVEVVRQASLGRCAPTNRVQPRIDLTPYGAAAQSVSRLHAMIRRTEVGVVIEDLASLNGTWLNGTPLEPYRPYPLQPGDRLQLGQLQMAIYFW